MLGKPIGDGNFAYKWLPRDRFLSGVMILLSSTTPARSIFYVEMDVE